MTIAAHSIGNMLVSAAIQDWQMPCERFFMLNAAVAAEAYDPSTNAVNAVTIDRMLPREWVGYDALLNAAHWSELFDVGVGRRKLTWKGRFSNVDSRGDRTRVWRISAADPCAFAQDMR